MDKRIIGLLTLLIIMGAGYFLFSQNQKEAVDGIRLGEIEIDYDKMQELQASVDEGHQPWRLDPLAVVQVEALVGYGFEESDGFTLVSTAASAGVAKVETTHKGKVYVITLVQPIPGEFQIWVIQNVERK